MELRKGFTLVELLVVIIILGILAAIAIPRYIATTERARAAEAIQQVGAIATDVEMNRTQNVTMTGWTMSNLGYTTNVTANVWTPDTTANIGSKFNYAFNGSNTTITATKLNVPAGAASVNTTIWYNVANKEWGGNHPGAPQGAQ